MTDFTTHEVVQFAGDSRQVVDLYVGPSREIIIDTSNKELRLQDGLTPGGISIKGRDANDQLYQAKSNELAGFKFKPGQTGIMVRLGAGAYSFRALEAQAGELVIGNANGVSGNLSISFAATITTPHTWSDVQTFSAAITAAGGVNGNVTGNLTGNVTGDLVGGIDTRGKTVHFSDEQIPQDAIAGLSGFDAYLVPPGVICMWSGIETNIPTGWFLCDGTNGTPNLSDRFIVAAGPTRASHSTGGNDHHTHTTTAAADGSHTHTGTVAGTAITEAQMPTHHHWIATSGAETGTSIDPTHTVSQTRTAGGDSDYRMVIGSGSPNVGLSSDSGGGGTHAHGLSVDAAGIHTHTMTTTPQDNIPAFYSLCFIQKGA